MGGVGATVTGAQQAAGRVGFFGKLPGRGDFVRRDLPNGFVDTWDAWLQRGMEASHNALGEGWLDAWLCAPIWRFALPAGICGADAWAGVMMPSVDRAGRYFPLTLAAAAAPGVPPAAVLDGEWIAALEAVALSALGEDGDFDRFAGGVANLPPLPPMRAEGWAGGWRARGTPGDPAALSVALALAGAAVSSPACVFATRGGARVAPAAWVFPQLPPPKAFAGFIDDVAAGIAPPAAPSWDATPQAMAPPPVADTALGHAAGLFGSDFATEAPPSLQGEPPGGAFDRLFEGGDAPADVGPPQPGAFEQAAFPAAPAQPAPEGDWISEAPADTAAGQPAAAEPPPPEPPAPQPPSAPLARELFGDDDDVPPAPGGGLFDRIDDKGRAP
jgi:type VI secretion system protein ImpM